MFNDKRKLRIGYYEDDGYFPTTPGIRRAIQNVKSKFEALGHELILFAPPRPDYVMNSFVSLLSADQSRYLLEALYVVNLVIVECKLIIPRILDLCRSGEEIDPVLRPTVVEKQF